MDAKLLHITDIHCNTEKLSQILHREDYDIIIATGDFECIEPLEILEQTNVKVLAVPGNMDPPHVIRKLKDLKWDIDGSISQFNDMVFGGVGGVEPSHSVEKLLQFNKGGNINIVLTHYPPKGLLDKTIFGIHIGLDRIRKLVETVNPRIVLTGHVHEARGIAHLGNTLIINPGPLLQGYYAIIEMGEETKPSLKKI
jgi:Icc-related predicted phosphoesterase